MSVLNSSDMLSAGTVWSDEGGGLMREEVTGRVQTVKEKPTHSTPKRKVSPDSRKR